MQKNVASQKLVVYAYDSTTNLPKTGDAANLTAYVSKDFGAVTILGDTSATEMDATNAKGFYLFDLTQGETNADTLVFTCKSATANIVVLANPATVFTTAPNFSLQSIDSNGRIDVIKVAGTTQTARDIGASVLLSSGTGTGQLDFTSGIVKANVTQLLGTAWLTPGTAGTPDVNVKLWNALTTVALPLVPTTAGRTLDVSTGGEAGVDWANVGSPTTTQTLTGTTIATTQKVDIETIKTNPVVNAGTITFPTTATLASTTNITGGTITTVGGNVVGSVGSISGVTFPTNFGTLGINASGHVSRVTLTDTLTTYTGNTVQTGDSFARIGSTGSSLTSLAPSATALSTVQWTNTLATNLGTLASHDPGATLGTSTLTQTQVTGGAYALNSASFAFNAGLDFTTTQKTSLGTAVSAAPVTLANGVHGGVAAVLTLERMIVTSTTTNEPGVKFTGNGSGAGLQSFGGVTGLGGYFRGGATSGHGLYIETQNAAYSGLALVAAGAGNALHAFGKFTIDDTFVISNGITSDITGNLIGTVATLTTYTGNTPQTGDAFARLGAPAGASVSADVAGVKTDTGFSKNFLEGDREIITGTTPWTEVIKIRGTGTVLATKILRDVAGTGITSTAVVIGSAKDS